MPTNQTFHQLYDFIDRAVKSRKYPANTGGALKTALNLFEKELNDEEKDSIETFKNNLDAIYNSVFQHNKDFSATSLATYKSRVVKVLGDFEKYGTGPSKMANWSPKVITRSKREKIDQRTKRENTDSNGDSTQEDGYHVFPFEGGVKLLIPKKKNFTKAIMQGKLSTITGLEEFSKKYSNDEANQDI
jgi:hypothetical protein